MQINQQDFERACANVVAVVTEHRDDDHDGIHDALGLLGLEPTITIDTAEAIVSDIDDPGLAFVTGLLVGVQLTQGVEV